MQDSNTLFIGKVLLQFKELPSTNEYAFEYLSKSKPTEGTVISAANQTAGRGQIGSRWESAPGQNLTISLILYPTFLPAWQNFQLNKAIALAVRDFVAAQLSQAVYIKWPNDIYVGNRKVGGILIQNILKRSFVDASVIGIGLNVNQTEFSREIPNPTSLALETNRAFELQPLLDQLCSFLESRYLQLRQKGASFPDEDYLDHLYRIHQISTFERPNGEIFAGIISGVSETCHLLIARDTEVESFDLKEIRLLLPAE